MAVESMKDKLLRIAIQRFAADGFEATTMRAVASRAGVTLPTLYHYFGDKQNLYLEACLATFGPRAEHGLTMFESSGGPPEKRIFDFFVGLATELLDNENFFKLMHREIIDQDKEGIRRLADTCWKPAYVALSHTFRALLPAGTDPIPVVFTSFSLMFGLVEFRRTAPFLHDSLQKFYTPRGLAELVLRTTLPAIRWQDISEPLPVARTA